MKLRGAKAEKIDRVYIDEGKGIGSISRVKAAKVALLPSLIIL